MLATVVAEKKARPSSLPSLSSTTSTLQLDPLLRDLSEKKQSFQRKVVSLASELKDVRSRLAQQEESFAQETLTRQAAESKVESMEEQICLLKRSLDDRNQQLQVTASCAEQKLETMKNLRSQLSITQAAADTSTASAQSAQNQCLSLLKELDVKNNSLKENEDRVIRLAEKLDLLQKDLQARELSQKQLKDEVIRMEKHIAEAIAKSESRKDCELRKILEEVSSKNIDNISKHLTAKDDEIARLRAEISFLTAHWKHKTEELESQLEKHRRTDQELKKRILKLEFCLQDARSQTRKLQRMGEKRDKALKELKDQLTIRQHHIVSYKKEQNIWESSGFKMVATISMLALVIFARR